MAKNFLPLCQLAATLVHIRKNAKEWLIDCEKIAVCGFSAGDHLVASLGTLFKYYMGTNKFLYVIKMKGEVNPIIRKEYLIEQELMKSNVDITFHPSGWNRYAGIEFDEKFFFDVEYRNEADVKMRRILWEYFGEYGIGEENPIPRPILFSDLIACGFLYSQLFSGPHFRHAKYTSVMEVL